MNFFHIFRLPGRKISVVLLCFLVAAAVSFGIAGLPDPDPVGVSDPGSSLCLPAFSEAFLSQVEHKQEFLALALPVPQEKPAVPQQELADRGERLTPVLQGLASWYGGSDGLDGLPTASGEVFNALDLTAAHRTLHFGTRVQVTYLRTGKSVVVRINDRGPFTGGRIIDLSRAAAEAIGLLPDGVGLVELVILD